mmetsp:Transcript_18416/g.25488  ORF Transcript_18416/g.25488 Transcript_18416/m.25488 type:complete len:87 (+) Transcript_18416:621-881(+)
MLSLSLLSKLVGKDSRGTMVSLFSIVGSIGILIISKLGGYLYSNVMPAWPFLITCIFFGILTLSLIILGPMGKLEIQNVPATLQKN